MTSILKRARTRAIAGLLLPAALLAAGSIWLQPEHQASRADAAAQPMPITISLVAGCQNQGTNFPAGTAIEMMGAAISPPGAVEAIWRYLNEEQRFVGWSPIAGAPNDYTNTISPLEPVYFCMRAAATLTLPPR